MCRAASCFLFSLCLLLRFVLNCAAKVQTYLLSTKQKTKNLCLFNVLQQIRLFLPKFIHILSTNLAKCAIYKAKIFAFRLITYVPYIITNNNAIFVQLLQRVCVYCVRVRGMLHPDFNHHYKITYLCQNTTTTNYVIYLFRVRVSFVACSCLVVFVMCGYCLSVDISVLCFQSLFCLCVYSGHYKDSTLLLWYAISRQIFCSCIFIHYVIG